jgi:hypothetical protein
VRSHIYRTDKKEVGWRGGAGPAEQQEAYGKYSLAAADVSLISFCSP